MTHTPGPWTVRAPSSHLAYVESREGDVLIAVCEEEEVVANAHLIAAAPDLLAALQELLGIVQHGEAPAYANLPQTDLASRWYVTLAGAVERLAEAATAQATP